MAKRPKCSHGYCPYESSPKAGQGLCWACYDYRQKTGRLPSLKLLARRVEKVELERIERDAWAAVYDEMVRRMGEGA